ncbi:hypothetical protein M0G74_17560, partial [Microbulbifer sp. CAU 1566]|uniref:hypothetical protein n=1 Tax=Microbulbifer sp. CAU 1566 TaxID=2933269 RepID=UPI0020057F1C
KAFKNNVFFSLDHRSGDPEKDAHYMAPISFGKLFFESFFQAWKAALTATLPTPKDLPETPVEHSASALGDLA